MWRKKIKSNGMKRKKKEKKSEGRELREEGEGKQREIGIRKKSG